METTKKIDLKVINVYRLHHEFYDKEHPLVVLNTGSENEKVNIGLTYDYERLPKEEWLFHADATLTYIPYGQLIVRTTFNVTCKPEELFSIAIMSLILKQALINVTTTFTSFFAENKLPSGNPVPVSELMVSNFLSAVIESYPSHAKRDKDNYYLNTTPGLTITTGGNTILIVQGCCMIMDHILYENPVFDGEHNRKEIAKYVPLEVYETIKWKLLQIEKGTVQLNWTHTIYLFICLDCALQTLLGEHADKLIPRLEEYGLIPIRQQEFITFSSDMLRVLKKKMKDDKMNVSNLNKQIDWNSLIR
jgi:hypothetical protein